MKNMKKALSFLVALMLMVAVGAQAQTLDLTYEGVTFTLPEDFEAFFSEDGDTVSINMYKSASLDNALFIIAVSTQDNQPSGDIEADLKAQYDVIADDLHEAAYEVKTIGVYTFFVITEGTGREVSYLTQADGMQIQVTCIAAFENEAGISAAQVEATEAIVVGMAIKSAVAE